MIFVFRPFKYYNNKKNYHCSIIWVAQKLYEKNYDVKEPNKKNNMNDSDITINTRVKWKIFQINSVESFNIHPWIIYIKNVFHIPTEHFQQQIKGFFMQGFEWDVHEKLYLHWIFFYCLEDRNYVVDSNNKKETIARAKRYFQMVHLTKRLFVIQLLLLSLLAHFIVHRNSFSFLDSHWHFHLKHKCSCSQALIDKGAKYNISLYTYLYKIHVCLFQMTSIYNALGESVFREKTNKKKLSNINNFREKRKRLSLPQKKTHKNLENYGKPVMLFTLANLFWEKFW